MRRLLDLLFPQNNICHLCGRTLAEAGECVLCSFCEEELTACRLLENEAEHEHPPLSICASAYAYTGRARELILSLKFQGDRAACLPLAAGMCDTYADAAALHGPDAVIPVPLHPRRRRERGYNQAELLASELCAHTGLMLDTEALRRVKNTKPQTGKAREDRLVGVAGAFMATRDISGAKVLLIDDVLTTGATLAACADALYIAGAREVAALTAACSLTGMRLD